MGATTLVGATALVRATTLVGATALEGAMLGTLVMVRTLPMEGMATVTVDPKARLPAPPLPLPLLPLQLEQPIAVCQVLAQVCHLVAHTEQRAQPRLRLSHLVPPG